MNITLSASKDVIQQAREVARRQGKSLNQLFREYLDTLVKLGEGKDTAAALFELTEEGGGSLRALPIDR